LVIEADAALLDELHQSHRRDRLGHRGNPKQRVGCERTPGRHVSHAERALIKDVVAIGNQRDNARHVMALDRARRLSSRAALLCEFCAFALPAKAATAMSAARTISAVFRFTEASLCTAEVFPRLTLAR
jgi:hypothetical protein